MICRLPKRGFLVPTKKIPSPKLCRRAQTQSCESITVEEFRGSTTLTSSRHHGTPVAVIDAELNADCRSLPGFPRQESTAAMYVPICSSACPHDRPANSVFLQVSAGKGYVATNRSAESAEFRLTNSLQSCRQAQEAPGWSWYGRWSGTTIAIAELDGHGLTRQSTTTAPTSISVRNRLPDGGLDMSGGGTRTRRLPHDMLQIRHERAGRQRRLTTWTRPSRLLRQGRHEAYVSEHHFDRHAGQLGLTFRPDFHLLRNHDWAPTINIEKLYVAPRHGPGRISH